MRFTKPSKADLLAALHTFWQSFTVVFAGWYAASGLDYHSISDVDSLKRFILALLAGVAGAGLSGLKAVAKNTHVTFRDGSFTLEETEDALALSNSA